MKNAFRWGLVTFCTSICSGVISAHGNFDGAFIFPMVMVSFIGAMFGAITLDMEG